MMRITIQLGNRDVASHLHGIDLSILLLYYELDKMIPGIKCLVATHLKMSAACSLIEACSNQCIIMRCFISCLIAAMGGWENVHGFLLFGYFS